MALKSYENQLVSNPYQGGGAFSASSSGSQNNYLPSDKYSRMYANTQADKQKRKEEEEEKRRQQAIIDQNLNNSMQKDRSVLDRVFDVVSTPGFVVQGAIQEGLPGAWKGLQAGLDGFAFGDKEYGKEYSFEGTASTITRALTNDTYDYADWQPETWYGKTGKFMVDVVGDVLLDPTTYLTGGASVVKSIAKGNGKRFAQDTAQKMTAQMARKIGDDMLLDITPEVAERIAHQANKYQGLLTTTGDVKFAGHTLKGSGDALRELGDKTVAPFYNSFTDSLRGTRLFDKFDTKSSLRHSARGDKMELVMSEYMKQQAIAIKSKKNKFLRENLGSLKKNMSDDVRSESDKMIKTLEDDASYEIKTFWDKATDNNILEHFITTRTGKSVEELQGTPIHAIMSTLMENENPVKYLRSIEGTQQGKIIKAILDKDGNFESLGAIADSWDGRKQWIRRTTPFNDLAKTLEEALDPPLRPLSDSDLASGIFINQKNLQLMSELAKNNKSMARMVNSSTKSKINILNDMLFDGKPILKARKYMEGKKDIADGVLNRTFGLIKEGRPEDVILSQLEHFVGKGTDDNYVDLLATLDDLDSLDISQYIGKQVRVYDPETHELIADNLTPKDIPTQVYKGTQRVTKTIDGLEDVVTYEDVYDTVMVQSYPLSKRTTPYSDSKRKNKELHLKEIADIQAGKPLSETQVIKGVLKQRQQLMDNVYAEMRDSATSLEHADWIEYQIADMEKGIFTDEELVRKIGEIEDALPQRFKHESTYTASRINPETGEWVEEVYNPFTRETTEQRLATLGQEQIQRALTERGTQSQYDIMVEMATNNARIGETLTNFGKSKNPNSQTVYKMEDGILYTKRVERMLNLDGAPLSEDAKQTLAFIMGKFKQMGMDEKRIHKLGTTLNNYVPHVLNKDILNNPKLKSMFERDYPEVFNQVFHSAGNRWNPHGSERSASLETLVNQILMDGTHPGMEGLGHTIHGVNEAMRPILKEAGVSGDFFETDLYKITQERMLQHAEVMYSDKYIDDILQNFGANVHPMNIKKDKIYYLNQREMKNVFLGGNGTEALTDAQQIELLRAMGMTTDNVYNKMMIEVPGSQVEKLLNASKRYGKTNITIWDLPESIAQEARSKGYTELIQEEANWLKVYDKCLNLWKQNATVLNPGFHLRNKFSNVFQNYLANGMEAIKSSTRDVAKGIIQGGDTRLIINDQLSYSYDEILDALVSHDIINVSDYKGALHGEEKGLFSYDNKGTGGLLEPIARRLGAPEIQKFDPTDTANFAPFRIGRHFGQQVEDIDRVVCFISSLKNGMNFADSADMVNKFLFDYSDITPLEKKFMKRIIPFYTFMKKNAPLQMEMLVTRQLPYKLASSTIRTSQEDADTEHLPAYMSDWIRLPIQFGQETDFYMNPSMPYDTLGMNLSSPAELVGMLSPFVKMPIEGALNHNFFFDAPITDEDDTFEQGRDKWVKYGLNTLGGAYNSLSKNIGGLMSGDETQTLEGASSLMGLTTRDHDTHKAMQDAIYRAIMNMEDNLQEEETQEAFKQPFEVYKQTKLKQYGY